MNYFSRNVFPERVHFFVEINLWLRFLSFNDYIFIVAFRVEISVGYSGRRRNLEIINSSGIYERND